MLSAKIFLIVGLPILVGSSYSYASPQQDWLNCQADADCVVVGSGCSFAAVNKQYQTEANQYYSELNTRMDCTGPSSSMGVKSKANHAVCRTGKDACKKPDGSLDINSTCAVKSCVLTME